MVYDCIIIGAGAAGLFCGAVFPRRINGLILEKTKRIGTKLLMSGSGQCNITHDGSIKDFVSCYGKNGGRVRSCLYQYHNMHLRNFLLEKGIETFVREDGKVFPKSLDAKEIKDMLCREAAKNGFSFEKEHPVTSLAREDDVWLVSTETAAYRGKTIVIASGGCSYPTSGSDGAMLRVLERDLDTQTVPVKPALSAVKCEDYPFGNLAGISFPHACARIFHKEKAAADQVGGLLLTHKDFSGPAIMNISKYGETGDLLKINYLHPLHYDEVFSKLKKALADTKVSPEKVIAGLFDVPKRFAAVMVARFGSSPKGLAKGLTEDSFTITSIGSFRSAMATSGGISLNEINTKTMELKKHPNLYAIGEVLDIDGITGGYNLQFAYSSACAAANALASSLR